jgi:hypothetical protein
MRDVGGSAARQFVRRHVEGGYSFRRSFWIHSLLLSWLLPILLLAVSSANYWRLPERLSSVLFLVTLILYWPIFVWGMSGAMRAAKIAQDADASKWRGRIAVIALFFLAIDSANFQVGSAGIIVDHVRMTFTGRYGPPAAVEVSSNGIDLVVSGELRQGSADEFRRVMQNSPQVKSVVLDSPGGLLQEGESLATIIAQYKLDTTVQRECLSACTLAFLAGQRRCVPPGKRLGFHAPSRLLELAHSTTRQAAAYQRNLYSKAGLSDSFITTALKTSNRKIWYPSDAELLAAHVTTPDCQ